jgi:hypothetical protein
LQGWLSTERESGAAVWSASAGADPGKADLAHPAMKKLLKFSVLLNLVLGVALAMVLRCGTGAGPSAAPPIAVQAEPQPVALLETAPTASVKEPEPFDWGQLESTNYRTYIANLRQIRCPEQTIRDIIREDLDGCYSSRREALQRKVNDDGPSIAGDISRQHDENALEALKREETAVLEALLGSETNTPGVAAVQAQPPPRAGRLNPAASEVSVPLVFQQIDPATLTFSPSESRAIDHLQQWFITQVGGPSQDPNDPAYRQRWIEAQSQMDDMTRGMLGTTAFQEYQLAARAAQQQEAGRQQ